MLNPTWLASLPTKQMAANALLLNPTQEILLVKPIYRDDWLLPGGVVEQQESPRSACQRELQEELGLTISVDRLLCLEYQSQTVDRPENLQFLFYGGQLSPEQISRITLPFQELSAYRFVSRSVARSLLSTRSSQRLDLAIEALNHQQSLYIEDGQRMG